MPVSRGAGRPRASSRRDLEDAAAELFLEQGYARTTIDDIARRAGVGRNTFFNYFEAKGDLLWVDLDESLAGLDAALAAQPTGLPPMTAALRAIGDVAASHPAGAVPIALTQADVMDTLAQFRTSGLARFERMSRSLAAFLGERTGRSARDLLVRSAAGALTAAAAAAVEHWALAGPSRGPLVAHVAAAVAPIGAGFGGVLR